MKNCHPCIRSVLLPMDPLDTAVPQIEPVFVKQL